MMTFLLEMDLYNCGDYNSKQSIVNIYITWQYFYDDKMYSKYLVTIRQEHLMQDKV